MSECQSPITDCLFILMVTVIFLHLLQVRMEETEQYFHLISYLDLQDDLEMITPTANQCQGSKPEIVPDPSDESYTGMKPNIMFRMIFI